MKKIIENLSYIQKNIKANKTLKNTFGNYSYRSAEDILVAVKPLLSPGHVLILSETIDLIGDRYYVKCHAKITDGEHEIGAFGYAREALDKKGMDQAQITGSSTSYARKYALQGLLLLDDNKDPDAYSPSAVATNPRADYFISFCEGLIATLGEGLPVLSHKKDIWEQLFVEFFSLKAPEISIASLEAAKKRVKKD